MLNVVNLIKSFIKELFPFDKIKEELKKEREEFEEERKKAISKSNDMLDNMKEIHRMGCRLSFVGSSEIENIILENIKIAQSLKDKELNKIMKEIMELLQKIKCLERFGIM